MLRFPGAFEMEALALGALRVLRGEEEALTYPP
jgi:butyrate kinase